MTVMLPFPVVRAKPDNGLKPSRYNILYEDAGDSWLFNTRRGGYLRFPATAADQLRFLAEPGEVWIRPEPSAAIPDDLPASVLEQLTAGEFLITADADELEMLKLANRAARFGTDGLSLTILPTLGCNLDCGYCYEDKRHGMMRPQVQEQIVEFVRRQSPILTTFGVTWFGGEPLLGMAIIDRLSTAFLEICEQHKIGYGADIITNGVLLTEPVARRLANLHVGAAQVTVDGPREVHNARRPKVRGGESFDVIVDNITATCELINISVRVNLDRGNAGRAEELIDDLAARGLAGRVTLSFAPLHADGKGCRDRGEVGSPQLFSLKEISELQIRLNRYAHERGFPFQALPLSRAHACCADKVQSFVVEPDGTLQKCWQTVSDPQQTIGDVFSGPRMGPNLLKWMSYDPFTPGFKCTSCKILPACMGWCPEKIMRDPSPESCNYIKHTVVEDLKLYYRTHQQTSSQPIPDASGCLRS